MNTIKTLMQVDVSHFSLLIETAEMAKNTG